MTNVLDEFAATFDRCWLCGTKAGQTWPPKLEIHHIARGSHRGAAREERAALIRTCQPCHRERLDSMPIVQQLAIKWKFDHDGYDLATVNRLRHRDANAIMESEVRVAYYEMMALREESDAHCGILYPFNQVR